MGRTLRVALGQHSLAGRKPVNQDFHGAVLPDEPLLGAKGIALALADGISSSQVSQIASETSVACFLSDYFSTPDSWSVKRSGRRVISAISAWLYAQTRRSSYRYEIDRGYVCTFSALIAKAATAHIFHVGDARIYRLRGRDLEQLSEDHRLPVGHGDCLSRALGVQPHLEIDYRALPLETGDLFLLATDGVHEHLNAAQIRELIAAHPDLDEAAQALVEAAYAAGSDDNLTVQLLRVLELPEPDGEELQRQLGELPPLPAVQPGMEVDGMRIVRPLHQSARSQVHLVEDLANGQRLALKVPSTEHLGDAAYLERFVCEEWIARRIDHPRVLRAVRREQPRRYFYSLSEYCEGQTLEQWMIDHPQPSLQQVRELIEQIGQALRALHRLEMLHQDLRPANLMVDASGAVTLIDFGSVHVAGLAERLPAALAESGPPGTAAYTAPEYFLGEPGGPRADLFSLAVITYQLLGSELPYGTAVAATRSRADQSRLRYRPLRAKRPDLPHWLDEVLRKALQPRPENRQEDVDEFVQALRKPGSEYLTARRRPLLERDPLRFWQGLSLLLGLALAASILLR